MDYDGYKRREEPRLKPGKKLLPFVAYYNLVAEQLFENETGAIRDFVEETKRLQELRLEDLASMAPLNAGGSPQSEDGNSAVEDGALADDEDGVLGQPGAARRQAAHARVARRHDVTSVLRCGPEVDASDAGETFALTAMFRDTDRSNSLSRSPPGSHGSHLGGKGCR